MVHCSVGTTVSKLHYGCKQEQMESYIYQWNDKAIKRKRKNKKSEVKEVFSYPRITHLISVWLECGQIMYTNLYLAA